MIAHRYVCDLCHKLIEQNFQGEIDGVALQFYEPTPGHSDMRKCDPRSGDNHICQRCWDLVRGPVAEPAPPPAQPLSSQNPLYENF